MVRRAERLIRVPAPRLAGMAAVLRTAALVAVCLVLAACGGSTPSAPPGPALVRYPGDGATVTIKNVQTALKQTSPAFRAFITARLHQLWVAGGSIPGCQESALIAVTAYRVDGFASASDEGMFGNGNCARGGNGALYASVGGAWREIAVTQSGYACSDLKKYRVPASVAGSSCLGTAGTPQPYQG